MILAHLRSGDWLHRRRVATYGAIALVCEIVVFIYFVLGTHGLIVPLDGAVTTDFVSFYAAGHLANAGTPYLAYDQVAHYLAEQRASGQWGAVYNFFFYPPVYMLLCQLLALLPYLASFVVFQAAAGLAYVLGIRAIIGRDMPWVPFMAFPVILQAIGLGQNSLLTAALFAWGTFFIERHPARAGILFGLLCYKPHFGLMVAVALLCGRHWRALGTACLTVLGLVLLSLLLHGVQTWTAFLHVASGAPSIFDTGRVRSSGLANTFGALRLLDVPSHLAIAGQLLVSLLAAIAVAIAWGRRGATTEGNLPGRAMALITATILALPVILFYDFTLAAVAIAWAVRGARHTGYLPWEKLNYLAVALVALFGRHLAEATHVPLFPLAGFALLGFAIVRTRRA